MPVEGKTGGEATNTVEEGARQGIADVGILKLRIAIPQGPSVIPDDDDNSSNSKRRRKTSEGRLTLEEEGRIKRDLQVATTPGFLAIPSTIKEAVTTRGKETRRDEERENFPAVVNERHSGLKLTVRLRKTVEEEGERQRPRIMLSVRKKIPSDGVGGANETVDVETIDGHVQQAIQPFAHSQSKSQSQTQTQTQEHQNHQQQKQPQKRPRIKVGTGNPIAEQPLSGKSITSTSLARPSAISRPKRAPYQVSESRPPNPFALAPSSTTATTTSTNLLSQTSISAMTANVSFIPSSTSTTPSNCLLPASKLPLPAFRPNNLTRVPIAALASVATMTPGEREEERLLRQSFHEIYTTLWSFITKADPSRCDSRMELCSRLVPFWLLLAPMDAHLATRFAFPSEAVVSNNESEEKWRRVSEEVSKIRQRLADLLVLERGKTTASELLVLEQRLCLEEEKFLYAKLKSEYNRKVTEFIARKRMMGDAGAPTPVSTNNTVPNTLPPQRILPKVAPPPPPPSSGWATGSGIQIVHSSNPPPLQTTPPQTSTPNTLLQPSPSPTPRFSPSSHHLTSANP